MNLNKTKLKNLNNINFNLNLLDYINCKIDDFIAQEARIEKVTMERNKLKVNVSDGANRAKFYVNANNIEGQNILQELLLSDKLIYIPLESFPNLELEYFKN